MKLKVLLFTLILIGSLKISQAQFSLTGNTYQQDFNSLPSSGTNYHISSLPTGWTFTETGTKSDQFFNADSVAEYNSPKGNTYSLGKLDSSDRAFGCAVQTIWVKTILGASFINNTGKSIKAITINYTGELWFCGRKNRNDSLQFSYRTSSPPGIQSSWKRFPQLDYITNTGVSALFTDGNLPQYRSTFSITLYDLNIAINDTLFLQWDDIDAPSTPDDVIGIDDFSLLLYLDDVFPPLLQSLNPSSPAIVTSTYPTFSATFSEPIKKGSGFINIMNEPQGTLFQSININDPAITVLGNQLSISANNLTRANDYTITVDSSAITDTIGNKFAGIYGKQWKFFLTSLTDNIPPAIDTLFPSPGTGASTNYITCRMYFKEPIKKGYGNIYIKNYFTNSLVQTFSIDSPAVIISGNQLYFKPSYLGLTKYYITMDENAIKDTANNKLPVFSKERWTFDLHAILGITPDNHPLLVNSLAPANGTSDLPEPYQFSIYWYEYIEKQYGFINIRKFENDSIVQQIDVRNAYVNANLSYFIISPIEGGNYYIEIPAGAFRNIAGTENTAFGKGAWTFSAHNYITIANGVWGNPAVWLGAKVPQYGRESVTIKHDVLLTNSFNIYSLKILFPGKLTVSEYVDFLIMH